MASSRKKNRMFGSKKNIIDRTCIIHESINATSTPSPDPLFEKLNFNFEGNITIEENCPLNGSIHSSKWTFQSKASIKLPIVCSLSSQKINCVAVKLKSGATKELHLSHYRMQIVEQNFEKEKIEKNSTKFVKSGDQVITIKPQPKSLLETIKWPLIGGGASLISIILLTCATTLIRRNSTSEVSVKIENSSTNNPEIQVNHSAQIYNSVSPSAPPFNPTFVEENKIHTPTKVETIEEKIAAIKAIKPGDRNALHNKKLHQLELELLNGSSNQNMA